MDPNNLPHHVYLHKDHKYRLKLGFYAAPSNPKAFSKAIRDELHNLKFTYCSDLNGLIMGFGKISSNELIAADIRHCINVVVNVDVYIFRPPIGSIIEAVVNQTSDNHVSCLVHNLFNVSIVRPENKPYDQWSGSKIKKNDKIDVKVISFDLTKKLPHITGEIIKKKDECYDFKDMHDSSSTKSSSPKNVSDITKSYNKNTASPSKFSSSDSESSNETSHMITKSKICADESTKTSPLSIDTTIKHVQTEDTALNPLTFSLSDSESTKTSPLSIDTTIKKHVQTENTALSPSTFSSSDSENSNEMNNMITKSKICVDESTKTSPLSIDTTIKKHVQTEDTAFSPSTFSSSDSESSNETSNMITKSKIDANVSTKTLPLSINTTIKHVQKKDTAFSPSKLILSDSESSAEMNNIISSSKMCDDKSIKKSPVSTNTTIKHEDTADNSSECSSDCSEFSSKIKTMITNLEKSVKNKSTRKSSCILTNNNNSKHIKSPLYSSTPIFNSEHNVNSINLMRNKQLEQLKKHFAKNNTEKHKSLDSVNMPNQFAKNKLFQSLNIIENNPLNATSVNTNKNLSSANKINRHGNLQCDSGISDSELKHKNISVNNSFSRKTEKSTKTTKKYRKSTEIVNAILNSISSNKMKSNANIAKYLVDSNNDEKEKNTIYTQHKQKLDKGILNNHKTTNESAVNSLKLSLSTKNIRKDDTPKKKDTDNIENQIKNKVFRKNSNIPSSMISDSDSNCSKDLKLPVKDLTHTTDFNKEIKNDSSSSDDEIYTKLRQNISKTQINTNHLNEKPKIQSLINNKIYSNTDESDSSSKLFYKTSKLSPKLIKSNVTKHNSISISENDGYNKSNDNNLLSNKKTFKKDNNKKVNEKLALPQLSNKKINKMDIIKHILDKDSSSDDDITALKIKISDEKQANEKVVKKKPTLNVSKSNKNDELINKNISNPFLKLYTANITSSSSDDETFIKNLLKSKKKSSGKKKSIPIVNEEQKKNILINQVLNSIKHKNKKQKQMLPASQTNSDASESNKQLFKDNKIKKDKSTVKTKSKKDVLHNLEISVEGPKTNMPNLNIQPSFNESADDEKDVIKKILKKRKIKKIKKADVPEQNMKSNIPTELNKQNKIKEKLLKVSIIDEIKNSDVKKKKKRQRDTKDRLLDDIINALEDSSNDYTPSKKKKKDHNLTIEKSRDFKDKKSDCNLTEVKIKKKKKSIHKEDVNLSDLIVKDKKKKRNDSFFESLQTNIKAKEDKTFAKLAKKEKVKSDPNFSETQSTITDKLSKINDKRKDKNVKNLKNTGSSKKKTKKLLKSQIKNFMLNQDNTHLDSLYNLLNSHLINS